MTEALVNVSEALPHCEEKSNCCLACMRIGTPSLFAGEKLPHQDGARHDGRKFRWRGIKDPRVAHRSVFLDKKLNSHRTRDVRVDQALRVVRELR